MLAGTFPRQLTAANRWLKRQLWQQESSAAFFDPLVENIHPLWVRGQIRAKVAGILSETADTQTFTLRPSGRWQGFKAGQHCNLTAEINGVRQTRTFSLSSSPQRFRQTGLISFTIKRIADGKVTPWLHRALAAGDVVELSQAFGDFTLPELRHADFTQTDFTQDSTVKPLFYLAGGSGITPILSHLHSLAAVRDARPIGLVYLVRDAEQVIAKDQIEALEKVLPGLRVRMIHTRERNGTARLTAADLEGIGAGIDLAAAEAYLCGPSGLVDTARALLGKAGTAEQAIHQALFSAPQPVVTDSSIGSLVRHSNGQVLDGDGQATLLEIAERGGLKPAHGCRQGICRQCSCKKTSGLVLNRLTGRLSGAGEETIQPCISLPQGPVTVDL